jgi:hypothetical protein
MRPCRPFRSGLGLRIGVGDVGAESLQAFVNRCGGTRSDHVANGELRAHHPVVRGLRIGFVGKVSDHQAAGRGNRLIAVKLVDEHAADQDDSDCCRQTKFCADAKIELCHGIPLRRHCADSKGVMAKLRMNVKARTTTGKHHLSRPAGARCAPAVAVSYAAQRAFVTSSKFRCADVCRSTRVAGARTQTCSSHAGRKCQEGDSAQAASRPSSGGTIPDHRSRPRGWPHSVVRPRSFGSKS